jgi:hypothetical protein
MSTYRVKARWQCLPEEADLIVSIKYYTNIAYPRTARSVDKPKLEWARPISEYAFLPE